MPTPSIQILRTDAQQVLNLDSISAVRSVVAASLANANAGTPLNPNLTTQQLWNEFYQIVTQPKSDIESIIANQLMKFLYAPPAPGGVGADKQVIFNDGGVLAGDPGLTFDKVTNALTITGDLTVDTNVLKVDTTNNRVGIGVAVTGFGSTLTVSGDIEIIGGNKTLFNSSGFLQIATSTANFLAFQTNSVERYRIASDGIATWSNVGGVAGTAMTLNATGLGVGGSPLYKLHAVVTSGAVGAFRASTAAIARLLVGNTVEDVELKVNANGDGQLTAGASKYLGLGSGGLNDRVILDTAGQVGIGVTPSAWTTSYNALNIGSGGSIAAYKSANYDQFYIGSNFFENTSGAWRFINNGYATQYWHNSGSHVWRISTTSNAAGANQPLTWTQAMTLTAGGDLLVGVTAAPSGTIGGSGFIADSNSRKQLHLATTASTSQVLAVFINPNGTVGTIETNGSSTAYNISSDYRLKEEVKPLTGALNRITALKPSTYKWKVDGSVGEGFIAHELAEVVPFAVSGQKDAVNADGSMKTQGVDLSKIIPILVAAVQELTARVQTLEAK